MLAELKVILTTPVQLLMAHSVSIDVEASTRAVNYSLPTYQPNLLVASQRDSVHSKKVIDSPVFVIGFHLYS